jgi:hypothetical protein
MYDSHVGLRVSVSPFLDASDRTYKTQPSPSELTLIIN